MSVAEELGPALPPRCVMRAKAQEAHQLVLILLETTVVGGDLARAARTLRKLQAVVGPAEGGRAVGSQL